MIIVTLLDKELPKGKCYVHLIQSAAPIKKSVSNANRILMKLLNKNTEVYNI